MEYWLCYDKCEDDILPGGEEWDGETPLDELDTSGMGADQCRSGKLLSGLQPGHRVFLIAGVFTPKRFYLWSTGIVTEKEREEWGETTVYYDGCVLSPVAELTGEDFGEFKRRRANFSTGFSRITEDPYLSELLDLAEANEPSDEPATIDDMQERVEADGDLDYPESERESRERALRWIVHRRGRKEFRNRLLKAYKGRCAVTGCDIPDLLEAAHIRPVAGSGNDRTRNGLLLRADIHTLFDLGLLAINPETKVVEIDEKLWDSEPYASLDGVKLGLPDSKLVWPDVEALTERWEQFQSGTK